MLSIKVMSLNMKRNYINWGKNTWKNRLHAIHQLIEKESPDIIGTQELTQETLKDVITYLPQYAWLGLGREGGSKGEYTAILYKKDLFDVLAHETFWLSTTPEKPSRAWFSAFPRTCTTCKLVLKDNPSVGFDVYNTHLDHLSYLSRIRSLDLITHKIETESTYPILLMGDFNATPGSKTLKNWKALLSQKYNDCLQSTYKDLNGTVGRSYHAFRGGKSGHPIDYIYTCNNFQIDHIRIHQEKIANQYPSDHYPIIAMLSVPKV